MPASLPVSCLTMAPRLDMLESFNRKPLSEMNLNNSLSIEEIYKQSSPRKAKQNGQNTAQKADHDIDNMLKTLKEQLEALLKSKPGKEMACSGTSNLYIIINTIFFVLYINNYKYFLPNTKDLSNLF
jgi:polo-like kinase 1